MADPDQADMFADVGCVLCPRVGAGPHADTCPEVTGLWPVEDLSAVCGICGAELTDFYRTIPIGSRHPMADTGGSLADLPTERIVCPPCGEVVPA